VHWLHNERFPQWATTPPCTTPSLSYGVSSRKRAKGRPVLLKIPAPLFTLIRPSAWKGCSPKFALRGFSEVHHVLFPRNGCRNAQEMGFR
jgi:hypothetical protein